MPPFGPLSNAKAVVQVPSEGEESEIDITDLLTSSTDPRLPSTQTQPGSSVQTAWAATSQSTAA